MPRQPSGSDENGNWSSFQLANSAPPLSVTGSAIAPSARMGGLLALRPHQLMVDGHAQLPRLGSREDNKESYSDRDPGNSRVVLLAARAALKLMKSHWMLSEHGNL